MNINEFELDIEDIDRDIKRDKDYKFFWLKKRKQIKGKLSYYMVYKIMNNHTGTYKINPNFKIVVNPKNKDNENQKTKNRD